MMILVIFIASTGLLMVLDINEHFPEEVHELLANTFILLVIAHIAGVVTNLGIKTV